MFKGIVWTLRDFNWFGFLIRALLDLGLADVSTRCSLYCNSSETVDIQNFPSFVSFMPWDSLYIKSLSLFGKKSLSSLSLSYSVVVMGLMLFSLGIFESKFVLVLSMIVVLKSKYLN